MLPIAKEIQYQDPRRLFQAFAQQPWAMLFHGGACHEWPESHQSQQHSEYHRYSYICYEPVTTLLCKQSNDQPFEILQRLLAATKYAVDDSLPPFQGGVAGYFSYDLALCLESLPKTHDDMDFPLLALGVYDAVISFDHLQQRAWVVASGWLEKNEKHKNDQQRIKRAEQRIEEILAQLAQPIAERIPSDIAIPRKAIQANFSESTYQQAVKKAQEYILAGDIFEVNIAQRFKTQLPAELSPFELYQRINALNPAPFSAYINFAEGYLVSNSPERFLKKTARQVCAQPIKGTAPRGDSPQGDRELADELRNSEKNRAENIMIVDLMRNDFSRVCKAHSVTVPALCELQTYNNVHHLVSVIGGELHDHCDAVDVLKACFPGGSISGAPKIRAMEIIAELEPTQRGPYCGNIGFIGFNGEMDLSIAIRTFAIKNQTVTFQAGGAVVLASDPHQEYLETLAKARDMFKALTL